MSCYRAKLEYLDAFTLTKKNRYKTHIPPLGFFTFVLFCDKKKNLMNEQRKTQMNLTSNPA